jgi:hypothetical protein
MTDLGSSIVGPYHLLLAHDVIDNEVAFRRWAEELRLLYSAQGKDEEVCIIMDSSVIELGHPMPLEACLDAGMMVRADVVVLPDVIGDAAGTLDFVRQAYNRVRNMGDAPEIMFVPQGKTLAEYVSSIEAVANYEWIQWIGLPRDALQFMKSRMDLLLACQILCPHKKIHMLGFSDNILDDFICCSTGIVHGIDSAVPVRAGMKSIEFKLSVDDYGKREDYWHNEKPITPTAVRNITNVRRWLELR